MFSSSKFVVSSSISVALLLASCGGDSTVDDASVSVSTETETTDTEPTIDTEPVVTDTEPVVTDAPPSTDEPATTEPPSASTEAPASTVEEGSDGASDGTEFTDPDGEYTITIGPDWEQSPVDAVGVGIEAWAVAPPSGDFAPNVNVLTEPAPGLDLGGYLERSVENLGTFDVISEDIVTGENGNELGIIEFSGPVTGTDLLLRFLAVVDVSDGTATLATLTGPDAGFADLRSAAEPFMLSLQGA